MANSQITLTSSNIKYLVVLYQLCAENGETRCVYVADKLGVSKPSVHTMMDNLKQMDIISKKKYGTVALTEKGIEVAELYHDYFIGLKEKFGKIFSNKSDVNSAAYAMLCEISPSGLEELLAYK
ncbi:MAG: hypothetical protein IJV39_01640 [Ruminococcus sp.]|nr:hypothetical protein [Ruminococcus sp.]